ncbi:acetyl-CoA synthetase-like protein [Aureobasidium sp. EXF-10727]|nr:acetyl-CoA synthetase-like protein [Aureobasidium sp. EXF-10727]
MGVKVTQSVLFKAIGGHDPASTAIVDLASGKEFTYGRLLRDVLYVKERLLQKMGREVLSGERVAFIVENGYRYVVTLLAIFSCNAIAVPLALSFPALELRHVINVSQAVALLASINFAAKAREVMTEGLEKLPSFYEIEELLDQSEEAIISDHDGPFTTDAGMMLFTSGTTAKPKGVMLSDATLAAQTQSLLTAWHYTPSDRLLHVLPLHHIHGTVNAILTPLLAGSCIEFMYPFKVEEVWKRFAAPFLQSDKTSCGINRTEIGSSAVAKPPITFFTAVPTIWSRMLDTFPSLSVDLQTAGREAVARKHLRLNISGSAALPKPIRDGWTKLSGGNVLLERYGMTEVGMALSCGLEDEDRIDGSVGWPLPSVEVRLVESNDESGVQTVIEHGAEFDIVSKKERQGEIQLRGPTVFDGYWANPAATAKEFTEDGWFKTGDIAIRRHVHGAGRAHSGSWAQGPAYFIQGRRSTDVIKTGGEKVSALEIEREILSLPEVSEAAVLGVPSQMWGQKVVAVIVLSKEYAHSGTPWTLADLRRSLKDRLVGYKIPQDLEVVDTIKRNAMGKINKKELSQAVFGDMEKIRRRSVVLLEQHKLLKTTAV